MDTLTIEARRRRALARSTDPTDWLILADMLEEMGDPDSASWRRRGAWYPGMRRALLVALGAPVNSGAGSQAGPFTVEFIRKKVTVEVTLRQVLREGPATPRTVRVFDERGYPFRVLWKLGTRGRPALVRLAKLEKNIIRLIDWMGQKEGA